MQSSQLTGKTIFISGGTGSWGNELTHQLLTNHNPKEIRIYSRGEHKQVEMSQRFENDSRLKFIIGDIRDKNILGLAMKGVDIVFHLAALKHVPVCEYNSWEAVLTNVVGTQNIIECAIANNVSTVVDVSTDKAVDPFNLYGVTKACGEKLMINANKNYLSNTKFFCIRAGNVMGTNGSVLPLFKRQIQEQNHITITDPTMTRFLMSTKEAIGLIFQAVNTAKGGEIFVMRMPATTVAHIAKIMIKLFGNTQTKQKIIGRRPGEKTHEVLVSPNESHRTKVLSNEYFVILPQYIDKKLEKTYEKLPGLGLEFFSSQTATQLTLSLFEQMLKKEKWLW